ncbi:transcription factor ORG2-like [Cornus florida]|uniref:transcription factor ORG2-like n=1 Tax=Cornus florida TaxID=4283 RepID=UPI0028A23C8D|nr:transcription factor ORG2-like [Cornus florida]
MLALSPPFFSPFGWPFEDPISHEHNYNNTSFNTQTQTTSHSLDLHFPSFQPQLGFCNESTLPLTAGDPTATVKKFNHNASERDRRKRINNLYSSLRSLLPAADQSKKLSIPQTVSRVIKYIPELQKEVERLVHKKEEILSMVSRQEDTNSIEKQGQVVEIQNSLCVVSASQLGDREVVVQISTVKDNKSLLSEVLLNLEEDGILLMNASSFESFGGWVFYNLQLQVQGTQNIEVEMLRVKLLWMYKEMELQFP